MQGFFAVAFFIDPSTLIARDGQSCEFPIHLKSFSSSPPISIPRASISLVMDALTPWDGAGGAGVQVLVVIELSHTAVMFKFRISAMVVLQLMTGNGALGGGQIPIARAPLRREPRIRASHAEFFAVSLSPNLLVQCTRGP